MADLKRPTEWDDIRHIADHMRPEDVAELRAAGHADTYAILRHSVEWSNLCMTLVCPKTNEPGAIVGVGPSPMPGFGHAWLLGTKAVEDNSLTFLRNSRSTMAEFWERGGYDGLYNYTHIDNTLHHRWLRWLGFKFLRRVKAGPMNAEFYEFAGLKR